MFGSALLQLARSVCVSQNAFFFITIVIIIIALVAELEPDQKFIPDPTLLTF